MKPTIPSHSRALASRSSLIRSSVIALGVLAFGSSASAQSAPSTDIFLVPISRNAEGWKVGVPANLTRFTGYDNQPAFAADGRSLYFTRQESGQTDIWRSDFGTGINQAVMTTSQGEYSAWPSDSLSAITVVRTEDDGTQRLWRLLPEKKEAELLFPDIKQVGYFAYANDTTVAMFVLGEPATLEIGVIGRQGTRRIASDIGRSLHRIPGSNDISYLQKGSGAWHVMRLNPASGKKDTLVRVRDGREDYAWLDSTTLVMGDESGLWIHELNGSQWVQLADFSFAGLKDISRIAVSRPTNARSAQWLAVTAIPPETRAKSSLSSPVVVNPSQIRSDIFILAADSMEGRGTGTAGGDRAANWLASEFKKAGLQPGGDSSTYLQWMPLMKGPVLVEGARSRARAVSSWQAWDTIPQTERLKAANVVGYIEGADPAKKDQVVLVTAHYDHIGIGAPVDGDSINNGADDDGSGTVALLELARQMAKGEKPARTIVFAAVTGEEVGLIGTRWYINNPLRPLENTVANLNIEMIGRPDSLTGGAGTAWLTGYERSTFGDLLASAGVPIVADPRPAQRFFERSDNIDFARRGIPAHTLSTFNLHGEYHTVKDEAETMDIQHMSRVIDAALVALRALANNADIPAWHPGGRP